jgi:pyruvate/2-oxoglutarate dehydrogenase complex dihydrolipoamide acyltransferase (E2) component
VSEHEGLCVVDWEEGRAEVAAPATGVLRMVTAAAGERVALGATLAVIDVLVARRPDRLG